MLRLASDHNFYEPIISRLQKQLPDLDIVRIREVGLADRPDDEVLEWAASEGRIVLTHDLKTFPDFAYERIAKGQSMPGVFAIPDDAPHNKVFEDLLLILECSQNNDWENQILYLPL
jgi:predicted nuclease of predicted toxin-antitoxin system